MVRIERLAHGINHNDAVPFEGALIVALGENNAFKQRSECRIGFDRILRNGRDGALKIVADRQNVLGKFGDRVLGCLFFVLLETAADRLSLGIRAEI